MINYHDQWQYSQEEVKRLTKENVNSKGYKYKDLCEQADELIVLQLESIEALKAEIGRLEKLDAINEILTAGYKQTIKELERDIKILNHKEG